jgi:HSP20 family molecular chaperone IbpA
MTRTYPPEAGMTNDLCQVEAKAHLGVLEIRLPKKPAARARRVEIRQG